MKLFMAVATVAAGLAVQNVEAGQGDYTLIVAPARFSVVQMAFDLIKKRPAVLVSYRGEASTAEPLLYAWNGTEWVFVSMQDYRDVRFLQDSPKQVVLLGDENTLPASLKDATSWSKNVQTFKALDNAALVNEFGRLFKWTSDEWSWFASRYNLKLQDEAEPYRRSSWYDQPGPFKRDAARNIGTPPSFAPSTPAATPDMPPVKVQDSSFKTEGLKAPPASLPANSGTVTVSPSGEVSAKP
jgi:hypothetical protein